MKRLFYSLIIATLVSTLAIGAEVRKATKEDFLVGNPDNTYTSPGGHVGHYISNQVVSPFAVDVRDHSAALNGSTDDSSAYSSASSSMGASGGTIIIPTIDNESIIGTTINPGSSGSYSKPIWYIGHGWNTNNQGIFGAASWLVPNVVLGSVIKSTGTASGITFNSTNVRGGGIKNLVFLGSGTGTTNGVFFNSASSTKVDLDTVGTFNHYIGFYFDNVVSNNARNLYAGGNGTGYKFGPTAVTDFDIYRLVTDSNNVGIDAAGSGIRIYGGLLQNDNVGILNRGISSSTFDGIWYEGLTTPISFDLSTNSVDWTLSNSRASDTKTITFPSSGAYTVQRMSILNSNFSGWTLRFPADGYVQRMYIQNSIINNLVGVDNVPFIELRNVYLGATGITLNQKAFPSYTLTFATTMTPDWLSGDEQYVVLTDNCTFNVPTNAPLGAEMTIYMRQDDVGGRTVSWGAGYHASWLDNNNTTYRYSTMTFKQQTAGQWLQKAAQVPWHD